MVAGFRLTTRRLLWLVPINVVLITYVLIYLETIPSKHVQKIQDGFRDFASKVEFNYLSSSPDVEDESEVAENTDTFSTHGYKLEKGKVEFKYLGNGGDTKQEPDEAVKDNHKIYQGTLLEESKEPKDFNIDSIRPPQDGKLDDYERANATILSLVRNSEVRDITKTIKKFEKSFNSKFQYPYTFINDRPFTDKFKAAMRKLSSARMDFVTIPEEIWDKPEWIDTDKESKAMEALHKQGVGHVMKQSYHNMCRFYSGNFYNMPELQKYKYYWRIEPSVDFYTDIKYDVFKYLSGTGKKYGFTINLFDSPDSIATLWPETLKFLNKGDNYKYVNPNGAFQWLLYDEQHPELIEKAGGYSTCHFWSNFEIADMDFFRQDAYNEWFKYLDSTGKFYYERWGDAPVHSIGVALFGDVKKDVHWFKDIGYFHAPYFNCPKNELVQGCEAGKFSQFDNLNNQNCMGTWIKQYGNAFEGVY